MEPTGKGDLYEKSDQQRGVQALLTKKTMVPWGAFALFLLWGTPHLMHGFADGIVSALGAFIYAIPFYASGKKIKTSYVSMLILWFLV